jgi:hypothetical protein
VDPEDIFFKGASRFNMNELVPEIGIPEGIANMDKPLGRLRMAGRHFVLQEYVIVKKADFFHLFSILWRIDNAEYGILAHSRSAFSGPPRYPDFHLAKSARMPHSALHKMLQ